MRGAAGARRCRPHRARRRRRSSSPRAAPEQARARPARRAARRAGWSRAARPTRRRALAPVRAQRRGSRRAATGSARRRSRTTARQGGRRGSRASARAPARFHSFRRRAPPSGRSSDSRAGFRARAARCVRAARGSGRSTRRDGATTRSRTRSRSPPGRDCRRIVGVRPKSKRAGGDLFNRSIRAGASVRRAEPCLRPRRRCVDQRRIAARRRG